MKIEELANYLSISKVTAYRLIEQRKIPFHKIGRSVRFHKRDVMTYLTNSRIGSVEK